MNGAEQWLSPMQRPSSGCVGAHLPPSIPGLEAQNPWHSNRSEERPQDSTALLANEATNRAPAVETGVLRAIAGEATSGPCLARCRRHAATHWPIADRGRDALDIGRRTPDKPVATGVRLYGVAWGIGVVLSHANSGDADTTEITWDTTAFCHELFAGSDAWLACAED